jgi:GT2 family glycosyltransferase
MAERLVDVLDSSGAVIHTYPIMLDDSGKRRMKLRTKPRRWRLPLMANRSPTRNSGH